MTFPFHRKAPRQISLTCSTIPLGNAQGRFNRSPWKSRGAHSRFTATSLKAVPSFSLDSERRKKTKHPQIWGFSWDWKTPQGFSWDFYGSWLAFPEAPRCWTKWRLPAPASWTPHFRPLERPGDRKPEMSEKKHEKNTREGTDELFDNRKSWENLGNMENQWDFAYRNWGFP